MQFHTEVITYTMMSCHLNYDWKANHSQQFMYLLLFFLSLLFYWKLVSELFEYINIGIYIQNHNVLFYKINYIYWEVELLQYLRMYVL